MELKDLLNGIKNTIIYKDKILKKSNKYEE